MPSGRVGRDGLEGLHPRVEQRLLLSSWAPMLCGRDRLHIIRIQAYVSEETASTLINCGRKHMHLHFLVINRQ